MTIDIGSYPRAGTDTIRPRTTIDLDFFEQGTEQVVIDPANSTLVIERSDPYPADNGLVTIDTQMRRLHLEGHSRIIGAFTLRGGTGVLHDQSRPIHGRIVQAKSDAPFPVENWFDVYLEVEAGAGVFMNRKPEHMSALIDEIPPNFANTPYASRTEINLYPKKRAAATGEPAALVEPGTPPAAVITMAQHAA